MDVDHQAAEQRMRYDVKVPVPEKEVFGLGLTAPSSSSIEMEAVVPPVLMKKILTTTNLLGRHH